MSHWPLYVSKLASPGDIRGVSCDADGAFLGAIPLLEKRGDNWRVRSVAALNKQFSARFGVLVDFTSKLDGLTVIASALNNKNIVKARIAAVQLRLPEIPIRSRLDSQTATEVALKLFDAGILSKSWESEKHPRWPAGHSDGGRFRPANGISQQENRSASQEQIAATPAKFTECNERCSKLLERYRTYSWSNVNEFHYRQCMNECLALG